MFRGAVSDAEALTVWIHEIGHAIDNHNGVGGNSDFSGELFLSTLPPLFNRYQLTNLVICAQLHQPG